MHHGFSEPFICGLFSDPEGKSVSAKEQAEKSTFDPEMEWKMLDGVTSDGG
jgi:hypothetical protein